MTFVGPALRPYTTLFRSDGARIAVDVEDDARVPGASRARDRHRRVAGRVVRVARARVGVLEERRNAVAEVRPAVERVVEPAVVVADPAVVLADDDVRRAGPPSLHDALPI